MPFRLRWPTEFPTIIQPFGVNHTGVPDFYTRFGLPAHEGIDFAAPTGSKIFACASGIVKQISNGRLPDGKVHPYGVHIRLQHDADDGIFETIYGHLLRPHKDLHTGAQITAGQWIASADNTGNSRGDHLHLTLKKQDATRNGETRFTLRDGSVVTYPRDIMDPTPFLEPFFREQPVNNRRCNLAFVEDVTIPDDTVLPGGSMFVKTWKVRNNGTTDWNDGYRFVFIANTPMTAFVEMPLPSAKAAEDATISIAMEAPRHPGRYKCTWRACDPEGNFFGHHIWTLIRVVKGN